MLLSTDAQDHRVRILLDTGCSIPLLSQKTAEKLRITLRQHNPTIPIENFMGQTVEGAGQYYTEPLLLRHRRHVTKERFEVSPMEEGIDIFLPFWWIAKHPPQGVWKDPEIRFNSARCLEKCTKYEQADFSLTWNDSVATDPTARAIGYLSGVAKEDPLGKVPEEFREYIGIMGKEAAESLPSHRPYNCQIKLQEGSTPPWEPIYPLSEEELRVLREWLKEMERTGKMKRSTSSAWSPILFVPKPHGRELRLCVDYWALNRITIPNRYSLPLMQELQDRMRRAQWFTKMDLKNGFHLIRVKEGDELKTAFRARYGLFEFQVMPFGLTNAPSTFQVMNHVLSDMLDVGVLAYMDDILVYADTEEGHDRTVKEVLKRLQNNGLAVALEKCVWKATEVEFLGYIIGRNGIRMAEDKVQAELDWKTLESLMEVQLFLGFANFYRRFIQNYSRVTRPLTELTKKEVGKEWAWNQQAESAFQELKHCFTTAPILAHFDPRKPILVETDASDFALGAVLSQRSEEGRLHPIAFHSRKFQPIEINY